MVEREEWAKALARALDAAPAGTTFCELFVRDSRTQSSRSDNTRDWLTIETGAQTSASARLWRGDVCTTLIGTVAIDTLEPFIASSTRSNTGRPAIRPLRDGTRAPLAPKIVKLSQDAAKAWIARMCDQGRTGIRGVVQAAVVEQTVDVIHYAATDGLSSVVQRPRTSALVRVDTPAGALVEGVALQGTEESIDADGPLARLSDSLQAIDGPGCEPDTKLPWVLRPNVAGTMLTPLQWIFRADVAASSGLSRALGRKIFPGSVHLVDRATTTTDDESHPVTPLQLVEGGVVKAFLHSSETATKAATRPNGRAIRAGEGDPAPGAWGLELLGDGGLALTDYNELSCRLEMFTSMPRPGTVSVTAAGWIVRGGVRRSRLRSIEIEFPVVDALRLVLATGNDAIDVAAADGVRAPSIALQPLFAQWIVH